MATLIYRVAETGHFELKNGVLTPEEMQRDGEVLSQCDLLYILYQVVCRYKWCAEAEL